MLGWEKITCPICRTEWTYDDCDVIGACEGNVFCNHCHCEIEADTQLPALLCGKCDYCKAMMIEGEFSSQQESRKKKREACEQ